MATIKIPELSEQEKKLSFKIFNLAITRVLKRAYSSLSEEGKKELEKIFTSGTEEEKYIAIKKYIPDFTKIFEEEAKKIENDLKAEIEKRV